MMCTRYVRTLGFAAVAAVLCMPATRCVQAQAASTAAPKASLYRGTVKTIDGTSLTLTTDGNEAVSFTLGPELRVQQLAPGSTDLKTAQAAAVGDIAIGDRVLVSARPTDGGTPTAARVILMKSGDIAQRNETAQADWRRRGAGGIVSAVDAGAGTVTISAGQRNETLATTKATIVRRYAAGSVKFEDAKPSTLVDVHAGDQLRVRGDKSADGTTIQAEEIVFGSFRNLAGTITGVDAASGVVTLKDMASKQTVSVVVTPASDLRNVPPAIATGLAARGRGVTGGPADAKPATGAPAAGVAGSAGAPEAGAGRGRSAGGDLSQMIERLPKTTVADLKPGSALMVVGSGSTDEPSARLTAIIVLSGVEPILAAVPQGGQPVTLSPWNLGGGDSGAATP